MPLIPVFHSTNPYPAYKVLAQDEEANPLFQK